MTRIPTELSPLARAFSLWAWDTSVRQRALELAARKVGITEDAWASAMSEARAEVGVPVFPESSVETLSHLLKTLTDKPANP